jgi:hypothetical protein
MVEHDIEIMPAATMLTDDAAEFPVRQGKVS